MWEARGYTGTRRCVLQRGKLAASKRHHWLGVAEKLSRCVIRLTVQAAWMLACDAYATCHCCCSCQQCCRVVSAHSSNSCSPLVDACSTRSATWWALSYCEAVHWGWSVLVALGEHAGVGPHTLAKHGLKQQCCCCLQRPAAVCLSWCAWVMGCTVLAWCWCHFGAFWPVLISCCIDQQH